MADSTHITIRNVSPELARRLKARAKAAGTSVNATVLALLEHELGVGERRKRLEERYGTWTEDDFREFDEALRAQRTVDDELWR